MNEEIHIEEAVPTVENASTSSTNEGIQTEESTPTAETAATSSPEEIEKIRLKMGDKLLKLYGIK